MARLTEHQGKRILDAGGIAVPRGGVAASPEEASRIAAGLQGPCVVKIQAWTTGRAAMGGVGFADSPTQAADHARRMLGMTVGQFPVTEVLVEEKIGIERELFLSIAVDDSARRAVLLLGFTGGSGIEERAGGGGGVHRIACDVARGPDEHALARAIQSSDLPAEVRVKIADAAAKAFIIARSVEARSLEINPLVVTTNGSILAADCRLTVDDYAVFRHPELGIEIARELDHPPTELERIAYRVEQEDHRGTFFFAQMNTVAQASGLGSSKGLVGFHGAGGGGSMMSMDAITNEGFTIANFCDTSGNPSPAKVYRAAMVILRQPGLVGYFGSGSGVANQEQFWSAYGLAKAFWEMNLDIPAVIRLGGNTEDRAVDILHSACRAPGERGVPAPVEAYKKTDSPAKIAARFAALVEENRATWRPRPSRKPAFVGWAGAVSFELNAGCVWIDGAMWAKHSAAIIARSNGLLRDDSGTPTLTLKAAEFAGKDSDMIACEVECRRDGIPGFFVTLDLPDLNPDEPD